MDQDRSNRLAQFTDWCRQHITGDEKGEAQIFLDRLFQGFGLGGIKEAGATLEQRIKKDDRGGSAFADLVWKPTVLIEMKKRGEDLAKHLTQAFDYWVRLVPNRPRWVVLCNFDEFRIYDFNADINEPQDTIKLTELPEHYTPLAFLFPTREEPRFRVDRIKATRESADLLAQVYNRLSIRKDVGPETAQRFILQALICLFSEDIGLLPKHFFTQLLDECTDPPKSFDLLGSLFRAMNSRNNKGGRFKDIAYFDGGIFAQPAAIELGDDEVMRLRAAAKHNWAHVSPDIFGTIFQHSMNKDERHAYGAHYTAPADIMKIVGPTIVQPWRHAIQSADSTDQLRKLQARLGTFKVLDPACGSGNFLYIAYRELKRIEVELHDRLQELRSRKEKGQQEFGVVTSKQFFGMDILPFAVELAKVTMSLAHKLAIDELHIEEKALPLDNLDGNILLRDALITTPDEPGGPATSRPPQRTSWPAADAIIGNPPFLGPKDVKPERGMPYVRALRALYPEVPGMADYCVYWLRRSHDHLPVATPDDPFRGRAGLVGTQNIRNNQSRVGGLDHVVQSGTIIEAVDNQPWSGEANVHVSIVNWVKTATSDAIGSSKPGANTVAPRRISIALEHELGLPTTRRLWTKVEPSSPLFEREARSNRRTTTTRGKRGKTRKDKSYELAVIDCDHINSALSDQTDVSIARTLACNERPQRVFQGITPGHKGFLLTPKERMALLKLDPASRSVIHPYLIGRELLTGTGTPERFLIDFEQRDLVQAQSFSAAFDRIEKQVLPTRAQNAAKDLKEHGEIRSHHKQFLDHWWKLAWDRADMLSRFAELSKRYLVCSRVTKRPVFEFVSKSIRPGDALQIFAFDDDYSFGILQSDAHWQWFVAKCSKLTERFRYTPESVFDTLPWPQSPTKKQIRAIAEAGREIRRIRAAALPTMTGGLRALYRTLELPGKNPLKDAHAALDAATLDAYAFNPKKDLLAQLLSLNLQVAARIDKGEPVTAPGIPPSYGDSADLITGDCIRP